MRPTNPATLSAKHLHLWLALAAAQTTTLRFTFEDSSFALVRSDLSSTGENVVVGGENVWRYDTFVNWDFFPSEDFVRFGDLNRIPACIPHFHEPCMGLCPRALRV